MLGTDTPNPFVFPGFSVHEELQRFVDACDLLESLWDEGAFGYGLLAALRPSADAVTP